MKYEFVTDRLGYRRFNASDLDFVVELFQDIRVIKYLPGDEPLTLDICKKYLQAFIETNNPKSLKRVYLVERLDNSEPIGYCGIQHVKEYKDYEVFYGFKPSAWGFGFATESGQRMKAECQKLNLQNVIAFADIRNFASQRVLEKIGYKKIKQVKLWKLDLFYYEMQL